MPQECLAGLVGVHWKTLGHIERGKFPFATTTFASPNIVIAGIGDTTTNYVDVGGATNAPARFYRVRLVP